MNLYIDMDGVVCDLHTTWQDFTNSQLTPDNWKHKAEQFIAKEGFTFLKPNNFNICAIYEWISLTDVEVFFLSSVGGLEDDLAVEVYKQKRSWLNTNGCRTYPLICVEHKGLKKHFANPHSILLDDTKQNIWDWKENHGLALHVKDKIDIDALEALYRTVPYNCVYKG